MKVKVFSFICVILLIFSCRKEELEFVQAPTDETITANSEIASLMQNTSANDGSNDNIIDKSNCFNIKFPLTVIANGFEITVSTDDDYKIIEYIFDDDDYDNDTLSIIFPITIVLEDFTEVTINNLSELNNYSKNCNGENEYDDDIECLDFKYPITGSVFNNQNEVIGSETFYSDKELNYFIEHLSNSDLVTLNFPIEVILKDGNTLNVYNLVELKNVINTHKNDCDEDDDYDYNDDDCDDCSKEQLEQVLTNCNGWEIDRLERYYNDYDDYYNGYTFNFSTDGTVVAYYQNNNYNGTWTASGTENNIVVAIDIPDLPYCNNNWILHEISKYTETKVDLRVDNKDRMRYKIDCE